MAGENVRAYEMEVVGWYFERACGALATSNSKDDFSVSSSPTCTSKAGIPVSRGCVRRWNRECQWSISHSLSQSNQFSQIVD